MKLYEAAKLTEEQARAYLESIRWPDGPICPHCGTFERIYRLEGEAHRAGLLKCGECRKQFTVTVGTIMHRSHIPLGKWVLAFHLLTSSKKGFSALQLQRNLGLGSYRTAWHMEHRIRLAMTEEPLASMLGNVVEVDETFVGGKPRKANKKADREPAKRGRGTSKTPVVALVERGGSVRTRVVADVNANNLRQIMRECVHPSACIVTDELSIYPSATEGFEGGHKTVKHGDGEYARWEEDGFPVHTNTAESFFSLVKRSVYGVHHNISRKHLHRYTAEREFVYNTRKLSDGERAALAIKGADGKWLPYRDSSRVEGMPQAGGTE